MRALDDEERAVMALVMPMLKARFGSGPITKPGGHFSALFLIDQSLQLDPERHMRTVPQEALEKILAVRASDLGIEVCRGMPEEIAGTKHGPERPNRAS